MKYKMSGDFYIPSLSPESIEYGFAQAGLLACSPDRLPIHSCTVAEWSGNSTYRGSLQLRG